MATTDKDAKTQELNSLFRSLGERGEEGELWKDHAENIAGHLLQQFTEFAGQTSENKIVLRPYGSAAEDLKRIDPDDVGDVDIVIFPNSENLIIHDEMIEYLPENPMHVRVKGVEHPVLQSCLVEGTEYIATSAIKNFHPAVYGPSAPYMLDFLTRFVQVMSRKKLGTIVAQWENNEVSPALQINYTQSFGSFSKEVERANDPQHWLNFDPVEWEWLIHMLWSSSKTRYTREHAKIITEYLEFASEVQMSMVNKGVLGLPQTFPILLQQLVFSDRVKQLLVRYRNIDGRSQNDSRRKEDKVTEAAEHDATPNSCHENKNGWNDESITQTTSASNVGSPEKAETDDNQRFTEDTGSTLRQPKMPGNSSGIPNQPSEHSPLNEETEIKEDSSNKREQNTNEDRNDLQSEANREQKPLDKKDELAYKSHITCNPDFKKLSSGTNFVFEHLFGPATKENKISSKGTKEENTDKAPIVGGFDLVPALRCPGWPQVSREWVKRERKWPSPDIVNKIIQEGFHLVVKPPKNGGNPDCDFRLSFSHAEYLLSQEMNDIQRECYRCLKKFHREYLSAKKTKGLVTFHLKNLLLQTIEETGAELWTESNRVECMMKLLGNLVEALRKKDLRHFFVRSYNLFCVDYIQSPEILNSLAGKVEKIMENPMQFAKELIQNEESLKNSQVKQEKRAPSSEPAAKPASREGHEQRDEPPPKDSQNLLNGPTEKSANHSKASSSTPSYRFHDLKDIYLVISRELTDMAFNDVNHTLEALDPLERTLVENLKEMITNRNFQDAEFRMIFEAFWNMIYLKVWMNPEPNMRRRMLDAIQGVVETLKYLLRQEDFALENVEAIVNRLLYPDTEDPFNLSHLLPAGIGVQVISRFINSLKLRAAPQQGVDHLDDVPLD